MIDRITVFVVLLIITALASWLGPHIDRPPSRFEVARHLLEDDRPQDAALLFEKPVWRGIAQYRAGRYERALGDFYSEKSTLALGASFSWGKPLEAAPPMPHRRLRSAPRESQKSR